MPQLDWTCYFSLIFWFLLTFVSLYFVVSRVLYDKIHRIISFRKDKARDFIKKRQDYQVKIHISQKKIDSYLAKYLRVSQIITYVLKQQIFLEELRLNKSYNKLIQVLDKYYQISLQERTTRYYREVKALSVEINLLTKKHLLR